MGMKKPLDEVIREDMKKTMEECERSMVQMTAERKLSSSRKYALMLSKQTMVIVFLIGVFVVGCLIASGLHNMKLMNDRAAYFDWGFGAILGVVIIAWIARSIVLQKQYKEELASYISSGQAKKDFENSIEMTVKKAEDMTIHYPIETFERLSDDEMSQADEEWDEYLLIATDRFYRMGSMMHPHGNDLYQVYVELRYQKQSDLDFKKLQEAEALIEDKLANLQEHDPMVQGKDFKADVKELVRKTLAECLPYFRADEICVAIRKNS